MYRLLLMLAISYQLLAVSPVMAHFVKSDSGIGAVLHVDPGDDPAAGEESSVILEFKDINNKFNLANCDCTLGIYKEGQEVFSERLTPIAPDQTLSSVNSFVFPEKNIYEIKVSGKSKDNLYPEFLLEYDMRVAREIKIEDANNKNVIPFSLILIGGAIIIALFTIGTVIVKNRV
jgi:hypothetical protein